MHRPASYRRFPRLTVASGAIALVAAGALGGCLKYKDHTVLMADGSGKISLTIGMKSAMLEMAEAQAKEAGAEKSGGMLDMDPDRLRKDFEGIVAFTEPVRKEDGEWTTFTFTGYFEDVNKVRMWNDEEADEEAGTPAGRELMIGFKFAKEGDGFVLEQTGGIFGDMAEIGDPGTDDDPEMTPEMKKMASEMAKTFLKGMFEGMEIASSVEMPGKVSKAEGHDPKEGRLASSAVTLDDILDDEKRKKVAGRKTIKVWCGAADVPAEQVTAFRTEMSAAKASWAKTVADFEAKKKAAPAEKPAEAPAPAPGPGGGGGNEPK